MKFFKISILLLLLIEFANCTFAESKYDVYIVKHEKGLPDENDSNDPFGGSFGTIFNPPLEENELRFEISKEITLSKENISEIDKFANKKTYKGCLPWLDSPIVVLLAARDENSKSILLTTSPTVEGLIEYETGSLLKENGKLRFFIDSDLGKYFSFIDMGLQEKIFKADPEYLRKGFESFFGISNEIPAHNFNFKNILPDDRRADNFSAGLHFLRLYEFQVDDLEKFSEQVLSSELDHYVKSEFDPTLFESEDLKGISKFFYARKGENYLQFVSKKHYEKSEKFHAIIISKERKNAFAVWAMIDHDRKRLAKEIQEFIKANNAMAFKIFSSVESEMTYNQNFVFSPVSVLQLLGMEYSASSENVRAKIRKVWGENFDEKSIFEFFKRMNWRYNDYSEDSLEFIANANSAWLSTSCQYKENFQNDLNSIFEAEMFSVDFSDSANTKAKISNFAKEKSRGIISNLDVPIDAQNVLVLMNVSAFKNFWLKKFTALGDDTFFLKDLKITSPFMRVVSWSIKYFEDEKFKCLKIPFISERYALVLLSDASEKNEEPKVSLADFENAIQNLKSAENIVLDLTMPKFSISECELNLSQELSKIKFPKTDYKNSILPESATNGISQMSFSTTNFKIDENGCEAASVSISIMSASAPPPKRVTFKLDKPFKFFLIDNINGAILYMGILNNPSSN